jgi:DNA processing protein
MAAHEAASGRPGGTTVVLGCGHAVDYPRPHARPGGLFDRVAGAGGAIVSESLPSDPPKAHRIRARNRIVVEAGMRPVVRDVE